MWFTSSPGNDWRIGKGAFTQDDAFGIGLASGTERLRITNGGFVGIGNNSPANKLSIGAATDVLNVTETLVSSAGRASVTANANGTSAIELVANATASADGFGMPAGAVGLCSIGTAPLVIGVNAAERLRIDPNGNLIPIVTSAAPTLATNLQMVFNLTSNTNLRISVRGSDGTTRVANITLA
jgi:hypothetical protein